MTQIRGRNNDRGEDDKMLSSRSECMVQAMWESDESRMSVAELKSVFNFLNLSYIRFTLCSCCVAFCICSFILIHPVVNGKHVVAALFVMGEEPVACAHKHDA